MDRDHAPVSISEAAPEDAAAFATFFREAWRQAGPGSLGFTGASDAVVEELTTPEAILARIGGPERRLYLAQRDDRVVGFAATRRLDRHAIELAGIIVLPEMTGTGIGVLLAERAIRAATAGGHRTMVVSTESTNTGAVRFYERLGFVVTEETTEMVAGDEVSLMRLERELP